MAVDYIRALSFLGLYIVPGRAGHSPARLRRRVLAFAGIPADGFTCWLPVALDQLADSCAVGSGIAFHGLCFSVRSLSS